MGIDGTDRLRAMARDCGAFFAESGLPHVGRHQPPDIDRRDHDTGLAADQPQCLEDERIIAGVAVDDEQARDAVVEKIVADVAQQAPQRFRAHLNAARHGAEIIAVAEWDRGRGNRARPLGGELGDLLGQHPVAHGGVCSLLLLRAERNEDSGILRLRLCKFDEGHIGQSVLARHVSLRFLGMCDRVQPAAARQGPA